MEGADRSTAYNRPPPPPPGVPTYARRNRDRRDRRAEHPSSLQASTEPTRCRRRRPAGRRSCWCCSHRRPTTHRCSRSVARRTSSTCRSRRRASRRPPCRRRSRAGAAAVIAPVMQPVAAARMQSARADDRARRDRGDRAIPFEANLRTCTSFVVYVDNVRRARHTRLCRTSCQERDGARRRHSAKADIATSSPQTTSPTCAAVRRVRGVPGVRPLVPGVRP